MYNKFSFETNEVIQNHSNNFDIQFAETEDIGKTKKTSVTPPGKINKIKISDGQS